jgi:hypothetical protein
MAAQFWDIQKIPEKGVYTKCEKAENKLPHFWDINRIFRWRTFSERCPDFGYY